MLSRFHLITGELQLKEYKYSIAIHQLPRKTNCSAWSVKLFWLCKKNLDPCLFLNAANLSLAMDKLLWAKHNGWSMGKI